MQILMHITLMVIKCGKTNIYYCSKYIYRNVIMKRRQRALMPDYLFINYTNFSLLSFLSLSLRSDPFAVNQKKSCHLRLINKFLSIESLSTPMITLASLRLMLFDIQSIFFQGLLRDNNIYKSIHTEYINKSRFMYS